MESIEQTSLKRKGNSSRDDDRKRVEREGDISSNDRSRFLCKELEEVRQTRKIMGDCEFFRAHLRHALSQCTHSECFVEIEKEGIDFMEDLEYLIMNKMPQKETHECVLLFLCERVLRLDYPVQRLERCLLIAHGHHSCENPSAWWFLCLYRFIAQQDVQFNGDYFLKEVRESGRTYIVRAIILSGTVSNFEILRTVKDAIDNDDHELLLAAGYFDYGAFKTLYPSECRIAQIRSHPMLQTLELYGLIVRDEMSNFKAAQKAMVRAILGGEPQLLQVLQKNSPHSVEELLKPMSEWVSLNTYEYSSDGKGKLVPFDNVQERGKLRGQCYDILVSWGVPMERHASRRIFSFEHLK